MEDGSEGQAACLSCERDEGRLRPRGEGDEVTRSLAQHTALAQHAPLVHGTVDLAIHHEEHACPLRLGSANGRLLGGGGHGGRGGRRRGGVGGGRVTAEHESLHPEVLACAERLHEAQR